MKRLKINRSKKLQVGDVVETSKNPRYIGEVVNIMSNSRETLEIILLDKTLKPIQTYEGAYKLKKVRCKYCKPFDYTKLRKRTNRFELGDVVQKTLAGRKKYGIIVGYTHPDGLLSTSYEKGYNGTDLFELIEISPRDLTRKRNSDGSIKKFVTHKSNCIVCHVNLWDNKKPRLVVPDVVERSQNKVSVEYEQK